MTAEPAADRPPVSLVGNVCELVIGPVAHGGHCVARWEGRVVFVRHSLPGERVVVRITEGDESSRFLRGDAIRVLAAGAGRVDAPCPYAGPGRCGGCDFQHVSPARQRELLGDVVAEQLQRLAGIERSVPVLPVQPDALGWRTRMAWAVSPDGAVGLRRHRSHEVEPVDVCPIAHPSMPVVGAEPRPGVRRIGSAVSSTRQQMVHIDGQRVAGPGHLTEQVGGRTFRVSGAGFWQVHPAAATTLVDAVVELGEPSPGERVVDLYSGVGLFAAFLGAAVAGAGAGGAAVAGAGAGGAAVAGAGAGGAAVAGAGAGGAGLGAGAARGRGGSVVAVESDAAAVRDARRNLHDQPHVQIVHDRVVQALSTGQAGAGLGVTSGGGVDLIVLDPPRTGAKARVVRGIADLNPARVVYVACDPAALARDIATFEERGYGLVDLRAYALFPMTHHVECVALLEPRRHPGSSHPTG